MDEKGNLVGLREVSIAPLLNLNGMPIRLKNKKGTASFSRVEGGYIATFGGVHQLLKYRKKQYPFPGPRFPTSAPGLIFDANFNKRMKAAVALNYGLRVVIAEEFLKDQKTLSGWVLQKQRWRRCVVRKARV